MSRVCSVMSCTTPSVVRPALIRWRDGGALVLHRNAAEGIVLALRVPGPVVRHQDAGQRRVAVELDAEHVPGLALMPVVGRVDLTAGRCELGNGDRSADRGEMPQRFPAHRPAVHGLQSLEQNISTFAPATALIEGAHDETEALEVVQSLLQVRRLDLRVWLHIAPLQSREPNLAADSTCMPAMTICSTT